MHGIVGPPCAVNENVKCIVEQTSINLNQARIHDGSIFTILTPRQDINNLNYAPLSVLVLKQKILYRTQVIKLYIEPYRFDHLNLLFLCGQIDE